MRAICLIVAVFCIPFALTTHNGATLLGILATTVFLALTVRASNKEQQS